MARIQIINPLPMRWESLYLGALNGHETKLVREKPIEGAELTVFMWADENTKKCLEFLPGKKIVFVRRYEYYSDLESVPWDKVDAVVFVNPWLAAGFKERTGIDPIVIPNSVDLTKWTFKDRKPGKNIAMVGFVNQKKNFPMAIQIMALLPRDYMLHVAGEIQDPATMDYVVNLGESLGVRIGFYGHVDNMDEWFEDKNYLLSTAISEGCPNNVIEAMAKGIKPVIHSWPGAVDLFSSQMVFETVGMASAMIQNRNVYRSSVYRDYVDQNFGKANMTIFGKLVEDVLVK